MHQSACMTNHTFTLPDGRTLGYACYGPEHGQPVLYFHGTPSSRLEPCLTEIYGTPIEPLLHQHNLRLIATDRPGMGVSTFHEARTFATVAADVAALAASLQLPPCPVLCWSGGGPYALAFAQLHSAFVKSVFLVAAFTRSFSEADVYQKLGWNKVYFTTAQQAPPVLQGTLALVKHVKIKTPIHQHLYELSNPDYALLKDVNHLNAFMQLTIKEAIKTSTDGAVQEAALYFQPFPFSVTDMHVPLHFWWGTSDTMVPYIHAKHLEKRATHVKPHYKMGEGHISVYVNCIAEILQTITGTL